MKRLWSARPGPQVVLLALLAIGPLHGQQAADFFRQNCISCHTIGGGRITGPDLKNVTSRKDRDWLVQFLQNPKAKIDGGDPYALELMEQARGVIMPTVPGMSSAAAQSLLELIDSESKLPKSQFVGLGISDAPFTADQAALGEKIFLGTQHLAKGGPPCISCHSTDAVGSLGGGRLGPDLTHVYERLGSRRATGMWLMAPATTTMQAIFRQRPLQPEEIPPLLAYIEASANRSPQTAATAAVTFFLLGFGGMVLGLVSAGTIWRNRLRGVRRQLVSGNGRGGER